MTIAIGLAAIHFAWLAAYHAPAISTPDANSYFAQARRIAREGTTAFALESPTQFVGPHWNPRSDGLYYCTHPPGFAFLLALPYALLDYPAATWVGSVLASLSLIAVFVLCRRWTEPPWALLAVALVALNPIINEHALFGDSHVAVQFLLLAALVCLLRSTRDGSIAWGVAAGLLAGAIPAVRYPETPYLLTLGLFAVWTGFRRRVALRTTVAFALGAALPLGALLARNHVVYGAFWKTGYIATGEQSAFSITLLVQHAPTYLWQLLTDGVGLVFPLGVVGIAALIRGPKTRREGLLLAGLVVPATLVYMAWYWWPDAQSMRFLIPTFPLYAVAAVWVLRQWLGGRRAAVGVSVALVLVMAAWGAPASHMAMRHLRRDNGVMADITASLKQHVPQGSVVIAGVGVQQQLDFVGLWKLADASLLGPPPDTAAAGMGPGEPDAKQRQQLDLPPDARDGAFVSSVWDWTADEDRVFLLVKEEDRIEWDRRLAGGTGLVELARIDLPKGQTPTRGRPRGERRQDALPLPDPDSIFDLALDGRPLLLLELGR